MARSQSKRSVHRAQAAHRFVKTATTPKANLDSLIMDRPQKALRFPQAKGKVLEEVEFFTSPSYHALGLTFRDKTRLDLVIDPCFTLEATYLDRETGNDHIIKQWRPMHNSLAQPLSASFQKFTNVFFSCSDHAAPRRSGTVRLRENALERHRRSGSVGIPRLRAKEDRRKKNSSMRSA